MEAVLLFVRSKFGKNLNIQKYSNFEMATQRLHSMNFTKIQTDISTAERDLGFFQTFL
jgi:hypothetical protein